MAWHRELLRVNGFVMMQEFDGGAVIQTGMRPVEILLHCLKVVCFRRRNGSKRGATRGYRRTFIAWCPTTARKLSADSNLANKWGTHRRSEHGC